MPVNLSQKFYNDDMLLNRRLHDGGTMLQYGHLDQWEGNLERTIGMAEAKSILAVLAGRVKYGGDHFVLERRGQPMAVPVSVAEYDRLETHARAAAQLQPLSPEWRRRQETLLAQPRTLRAQFGSSERRLAELLADLPPADDAFWLEVLETS
jgi:hypothetical protein